MKIIDLHSFIVSKGCNISYGTLYNILSGKEISFESAYALSLTFTEKTIMEWKKTNHVDIKKFLIENVPEKIKRVGQKSFHSRAWYMKNLKAKYGVEIFKDFKSVKNKPFFTLAWIGKKYGFSRERARQLFNKIYGEKYGDRLKIKNSTIEKDCKHNPKTKVAEYKKTGSLYAGAIVEKLFMCRCEQYGFDVLIPSSQSVDIEVNGFLIDVKSSVGKHKTSSTTKMEYYIFKISKSQRNQCHFFACYIKDIDSFFIIPNKDRGTVFKKLKTIYITLTESFDSRSKRKYHEYKNKFESLNSKIKGA